MLNFFTNLSTQWPIAQEQSPGDVLKNLQQFIGKNLQLRHFLIKLQTLAYNFTKNKGAVAGASL